MGAAMGEKGKSEKSDVDGREEFEGNWEEG